jgi:hypothetical protein
MEIGTLKVLVGGAFIVVATCATVVGLLAQRSPKLPLSLILFVSWAALGLPVAWSNDVDPLWWFRRFFPILVLLVMLQPTILAFRSLAQIRIGYTTLIVLGAVMTLKDELHLLTLQGRSIQDVYELRKLGGAYYGAFTLSLTFPLLVAQGFGWTKKLFILAAMTVCVTGLIVSVTRTLWISTLVALLFAIYLASRTRDRVLGAYFARTLILIGVAGGLLLAGGPQEVQDLVLNRARSIVKVTDINDLSGRDRLNELAGLLESSWQNPLGIVVGNGLGAKFSFENIDPFLWSEGTGKGETGLIQNDYTHDYYAYLYWTTGLVGLSLFLTSWGRLLMKMARTIRRLPTWSEADCYCAGIATALVNLAVSSLTGPPLMSFKWTAYFAVLGALAINLMKLGRFSPDMVVPQ